MGKWHYYSIIKFIILKKRVNNYSCIAIHLQVEMGKVKEENESVSVSASRKSKFRCKYMPYNNKAEVFKGHQEGLDRAIFECDCPEHAAQFKTTLKELALYVECKFKGVDDIGYILWELKNVVVTFHAKPTGVTDEYNKVIWSKKR